jgi:hypothetical protein
MSRERGLCCVNIVTWYVVLLCLLFDALEVLIDG